MKQKGQYQRGLRAEKWARVWLRLKGYRILGQRVKTPVGEIDIIAARGKNLAFIEVKYRRDFEEALWTVTLRQQERIARAASYWLANPANNICDWQQMRFDVVIITPGRLPRHLISAFEANQ